MDPSTAYNFVLSRRELVRTGSVVSYPRSSCLGRLSVLAARPLADRVEGTCKRIDGSGGGSIAPDRALSWSVIVARRGRFS